MYFLTLTFSVLGFKVSDNKLGSMSIWVPAGHTGVAGSIPESGRSLEKEMATHCSILAWEIPWTEEPGGLQSVRSLGVGHN